MSRKNTPDLAQKLAQKLPSSRTLSRRAALLAPLVLGACSWFNWITGEGKETHIPGIREPVLAPARGLGVDAPGDIVLPGVVRNKSWTQFGGDPSHIGGNLEGGLTKAWTADVGTGGNWRARFTAEPLVVDNQVFTMDTDGVVRSFALATGARQWSTDTRPEDNDNDSIGGGLGYSRGRLYAATGRAELVAIDPASGAIAWRVPLTGPARGAPTIDGDHIYLTTVDEKLLCLSRIDGKALWHFQANTGVAGMLGVAAPAIANGIVVAGFESGDLVALRADTGTVVWSDNLGALKGTTGMSEFASIRGGLVIQNAIVYAIGLGGLFAAIDLRSGRRVWQRDVAGANTPWLAGDVLYVLSIEQRLAAVSALDGTVFWSTEMPRFENPKRTKNLITWYGPVMASGKLLLVNDQEQMAVVDPIFGKIVSTMEIPDTASLRPIIADGTVFVLTDDATLTAFR